MYTIRIQLLSSGFSSELVFSGVSQEEMDKISAAIVRREGHPIIVTSSEGYVTFKPVDVVSMKATR